MKFYIGTESCDLWWGVYDISDKVGWEDINIFDENNTKIGCFCLNTKAYLRNALYDLPTINEEDKQFISAIQRYLIDKESHFWYYYDDEDFYEVSYKAPVNNLGVKPSFLEIWHPDEKIDLSTILNATEIFLQKFLKYSKEDYELEIIRDVSFEDSLKSFLEHQERFSDPNFYITFSNELIDKLALKLNMTKNEVKDYLKKLTK